MTDLIHRFDVGASDIQGMPIDTIGDFPAALTSDASSATVQLSLPALSLTEQRWVFDQAVRKVRGLMPAKRAEFSFGSDVPATLRDALLLDAAHAYGGLEHVKTSSTLDDALSRCARFEALYRDWVNEDAATRTSLRIAEDVQAWAKTTSDVTVEIFEEDQLREQRMRLLLAVGQGSTASPSRLVVARYTPGGSTEAPIALVGKGVTFDTGGINVKPYEYFVSMMKNDMGGAALAHALFRALVDANCRKPLVLVIPTCENAVDGNSMRPGAVIESRKGTKVRVDHTDAEGRLILADALDYAATDLKPERTFCWATLTTAALIGYGPYATPVHFADSAVTEAFGAASEETGEDLHFFPERIWHRQNNCDPEADLRNTAQFPSHAGKGAGSRNAAHFVQHFAPKSFCHVDIFASTWNWSGEAPATGYGATGAPFRSMFTGLSKLIG